MLDIQLLSVTPYSLKLGQMFSLQPDQKVKQSSTRPAEAITFVTITISFIQLALPFGYVHGADCVTVILFSMCNETAIQQLLQVH